MLGSKGILARQTLYKFLTQKGDELMLEVKNLTFQVNENGIERSIVENISFNVKDGEMLVITGPIRYQKYRFWKEKMLRGFLR